MGDVKSVVVLVEVHVEVVGCTCMHGYLEYESVMSA